MSKRKQKLFHRFRILFPLTAIAIFASYGSLIKNIVATVPPFLILLYVQSFVVFLFFFSLGVVPESKRVIHDSKHKWIPLIALSFCSGVLGPLSLYFGLKFTTATNSALLSNTNALFLIIFSILIFKEKLKVYRLVGMCILLIGAVIIVLKGQMTTIVFNKGDLFIVLANLFWSTADVIYKKWLKGVRPDVMIMARNVISLIVMAILVYFTIPYAELFVSSDTIPYFIAIAIFPLILGQFFWYRSLKLCSGMMLSIAILCAPLFGVFFAWMLLGEQLQGYHLIGGIFIIFGMAISRMKKDHHLFHKLFHIKHMVR